MIRPVEKSDLNQLRLIRNKWQKLGIFRQAHDITEKEQANWFKNESNPGVIINERAYGKIYNDNEISFYGFDEWLLPDINELMHKGNKRLYYGECYQHNQFLTLWLAVGFKVVGHLKNRKYWDGRMWDSLLLEKENENFCDRS